MVDQSADGGIRQEMFVSLRTCLKLWRLGGLVVDKGEEEIALFLGWPERTEGNESQPHLHTLNKDNHNYDFYYPNKYLSDCSR